MAQRPPGALAGVASYVDTPPGGCIYSDEFSGAVAQLGERRAGSAEVRGSIPLGSTPHALPVRTRTTLVVSDAPPGLLRHGAGCILTSPGNGDRRKVARHEYTCRVAVY